MPIIKSAKKRVRVANKAAVRNSKTKRQLKTALKSFKAKPSLDNLAAAQSSIDLSLKKGLLHKNKAARLKKRAAAAAKLAKLKPAAKKAVKKAAPAPKKTVAKKTSKT